MVDANAVREGLKEWLENPHWSGYYNGAPSDKCKEYIALDLYYSDTEDDEVAEAMDAMESQLSVEDWKWILKYTSGPGQARIIQKIHELEG